MCYYIKLSRSQLNTCTLMQRTDDKQCKSISDNYDYYILLESIKVKTLKWYKY